jgi:hypothetical protein
MNISFRNAASAWRAGELWCGGAGKEKELIDPRDPQIEGSDCAESG